MIENQIFQIYPVEEIDDMMKLYAPTITIVNHLSDEDIEEECTVSSEDSKGKIEEIKNEQEQECSSETKYCNRKVFLSSEENNYTRDPLFLNYLQTTKTFHQTAEKCTNNDLPRKKVLNHWDAINSVVVVQNEAIERAFNDQKKKFATEGKVDKYGKVPEHFQFHGTA